MDTFRMKLRSVLTTLVVFMLVLETVKCFDETIVKTKNGEVEGFVEVLSEYQSVRIKTWLGIPYAKPPISFKRFKRPEPVDNWDGVKKATTQPNVCFQTSDSGYMVLPKTFDMWDPKGSMSEDCLYLNVYAPTKDIGKKYTTLIWIHGGGFYKGAVSLEQYNPKMLVAKHNVIVVTIQYRLGVFGFLYFKNENIPGNMGLSDQAMAIKWIYDNIDSFGGDRNDITLMGESAGSASVGYHMISKKTQNYFQKGIMQSGSPFCFWGYADPQENYDRSRLYAAYAKCKHHDFQKLYACLMNMSPQQLLSADKSILSLAPTIDGDFIDKSPFEAIQKGDYARKPILGGLVQNEGMPGIIYFMKQVRTIDYDKFTPLDLDVFIRLLAFYTRVDALDLWKIAIGYFKYYKPGKKPYLEQTATHLFGDLFISCGAIDFLANITSSKTPVYFYYFNHRWQMNPDPEYTEVMHGSEIQFQFGQPFVKKQKYTDDDRQISQVIMSYWAEFAKTSKPKESWKPYLEKSGPFYEIKGEKESTEIMSREKFCEMWRKYKSKYDILKAREVKQFMKKAIMLAYGEKVGLAIWYAFQSRRYEDVW